MILTNKLIERIREKLSEKPVPSFITDTSYEYAIFESEGEYKKPVREENRVTKYINCVASVIGDEKTGINAQTMTYSITMKLDFLIPDATVEKDGESFGNAVISTINSAFNLPDSYTDLDDSGILYNVVGVYSTVTPGLKEIRPSVGESLTASVFVDWVISTQGYSSSNVKLYIGDTLKQIFYSRLDISRTTTQESNISSDNSDGISKSVDVSTAVIISIIKPDRMDALDDIISSYLAEGENNTQKCSLQWPKAISESGVLTYKYASFLVSIREASKGAEGLDVPSNTCTFVEKLIM